MSAGLGERAEALVLGGAGLLFSIVYVLYARSIEDSLLADSVGVAGVPGVVGGLLGLASLALLVKGALTPAREAGADDTASAPDRAHRLALGLLAILASYVVLLPLLGYVVSIGLFAGAVTLFAGGRNPKAVAGMLVLTGPLLWLLFDMALQVRMPAGFWPALLSG